MKALSLGLTAAAFWWPGSAGGLTVSRPAAVPLRRQGRTGTLSVSDPTRTGEPQELEWGSPVRKVPDHPDAVEILPTGPRPRLRVTRGEACATRV
ncbi:polysaccharide lyase beta-sandwich domain-containing protein [Streptomyces sp. yara]|uniref:polysaccharide lyase beta-sandwich domain-containing protein n=1 Tax=Streptomyces sp. yara TaxID=3458421 RepID=UPI00403FEEC0